MHVLAVFRRLVAVCLVIIASLACFGPTAAFADTIRIVTYNILADSGTTTKGTDFYTVLQGIGNENVNGTARPIDVLSLEETTSNTVTVDPIVTNLNNTYGAGTYARSPYQATQNGSPTSGNGPNAMVYKTTSLQLIGSVGIGTPSSSGAPRQPVRYQFRPVGGSASLDFYVYVSHMKSGTTSSDKTRRGVEAQMLRSDAATLPSGARIVYTGDFNWNDSNDPAYVNFAAAGLGQAFDPLNRPGSWALNAAFKDILTESATNLRYRDDCHLVTQNVMSDPSGLQYISGSYHTFAVNGSTPVNGNVNSPSNTALPGLPNRSAVLAALITATDHLPVIADYNLTAGGGTAPSFTDQPINQTACSGGSASFIASATGSPAPTYQWRRGTTNLTDNGNISGATTATLIINPAGTGDAATDYNCVATNSNGSATSNNASLTVNTGPAVTTQPTNQTVCSGGSAGFTVAASGSPAPTYQWRKSTTNLSNGGNISGATAATLTINPAGTGDAASNYNCVVTNTCGSATSNNASLTVSEEPSIGTQPQGQALVVNGMAVFTVAASGSPSPGYQWRKDTLPLTDGGEISGSTTATLTINPATAADAGNYDVVITNTCDSVTSAQAPFWLLGDLNCDLAVDGLDIESFMQALLDPAGYAVDRAGCNILNADFDADSVVTTADISGFVTALLGG